MRRRRPWALTRSWRAAVFTEPSEAVRAALTVWDEDENAKVYVDLGLKYGRLSYGITGDSEMWVANFNGSYASYELLQTMVDAEDCYFGLL